MVWQTSGLRQLCKRQGACKDGKMAGWVAFQPFESARNHLAEGAMHSAEKSIVGVDTARKFLALAVSCIGRQIVMKHRVDEEIEEASQVLGGKKVMCGFYSLGEICPQAVGEKWPKYHNQTMTITTVGDSDE